MQFPITIGLHRSFLQRRVLFGIAVVAAVVVVFLPWAWPVRGLLLFTLLMSTWLAAWRLHSSVQSLLLSKEGILSVQFAGHEAAYFPMLILPGATVHPWLTVLRLNYEGQLLTLLLPPDCLTADDFRRLRVWLKWRATLGAADDDA